MALRVIHNHGLLQIIIRHTGQVQHTTEVQAAEYLLAHTEPLRVAAAPVHTGAVRQVAATAVVIAVAEAAVAAVAHIHLAVPEAVVHSLAAVAAAAPEAEAVHPAVEVLHQDAVNILSIHQF